MALRSRRSAPAPTSPTDQPPSPPPATPPSHFLLHACCVFAAAVLAFANSLHGAFVFDDLAAVVRNPDVVEPSAPWGRLWTNDFWGGSLRRDGGHKSYRPLTVLSYRLNHHLFDLEPWGYHATNVALHGATAVLYFVFLRRVAGGAGWRSGAKRRGAGPGDARARRGGSGPGARALRRPGTGRVSAVLEWEPDPAAVPSY